MKKIILLIFISLSFTVRAQLITNVSVSNILGSDSFEGNTPWVNFDSQGYNRSLNNQLGGVQNFSWSSDWGGAAINSGASASGGTQSMQIHWGGVERIQGFVYNSSKIYQLELLVHPAGGNDGTWNNWAAIHLFVANNSNLWQTTGIRIRLNNGGAGASPNQLALDIWEGAQVNYVGVTVKDFNSNPLDYYVDGTSAKYWIPLKIVFTGAGNTNSPFKIDFYLNNSFMGSQSITNLTGFGDGLIGFSRNGSDSDNAKFDNIVLTELRNGTPTEIQRTGNSNEIPYFSCENNTLNTNYTSDSLITFDVISTQGTIVYRGNISGNNTKIPMDKFDRGIYFIRINNSAESKPVILKFIH